MDFLGSLRDSFKVGYDSLGSFQALKDLKKILLRFLDVLRIVKGFFGILARFFQGLMRILWDFWDPFNIL